MLRKTLYSLFALLVLTHAATAIAATFNDGVAAYQRAEYKKALQIWERLAEDGNMVAQMLTGSLYAYGEGAERDDKKAFYWFNKSANSGYARAQFNLGIMHEKGWGTEQNTEKAMFWYQQAAAQGREDARKKIASLGLLASKNKPPALSAPIEKNNAAPSKPAASKPVAPKVSKNKQTETAIKNKTDNKPSVSEKQKDRLFTSQLTSPVKTQVTKERNKSPKKAKPDTKKQNKKPTKRIALLLDTNKKKITSNSANKSAGKNGWLQKQNPEHFTIQLASNSKLSALQSFIKEVNLKNQFSIVKRTRNDSHTYSIVYGAYKDIADAQSAIQKLPPAWRKYVPWIRDIGSVQR